MKKIFLLILSLVIIGAGCKSGQYSQPSKNHPTSSVPIPTTSANKNQTKATTDTPELRALTLALEVQKKNNLTQYEIVSYHLMEKQNILFFTVVTHERNSTSEESEKTETTLYMYNLDTKEVTKIISSTEIPKSLIFDIDNPSITSLTALPYLYVDGTATLSANNKYLQVKTYDIGFGEWFFKHTILIDLETKKVKNIGRTEEFEWLGENKFRYRPSIPYTKDCYIEVGPNVCFRAGQWKTNQF